ncbi:hypothetical protein CVT24_011601 [Panaeolus cyanescens]|uniref:Uncharacterized protein n=1 Tax=Panaeolus cyanescens TaxID=181874 RepID=A0A409YV69_9AGAR|nr:hypothetical protein CVT24_011601 [Panaeolus cyanescens]
MFLRLLPRADTESDGCSSGHISCTPSTAISGTDTGNRDPSSLDSSTPNPKYMHDGPHRYIGIGMVAAMLTTAFLIWLYYTKCPRNEQGMRDISLIHWPCCRTRRPKKEPTHDDDLESVTTKAHMHDDNGKNWGRTIKDGRNPLILDEGQKGLEKPRFEEPQVIDLDADAKFKPLSQAQGTRSAVKEKRKPSGRMNPTGKRRSGVRKEVSGGMVIYTEVASPPRAIVAPGRDREARNVPNMSERQLERTQSKAPRRQQHERTHPER